MTLVGMSFDRVAFDSSKFLISLIISVKITLMNENGKATSDGIYFLILVYLDGCQTFLLHLTPDHGEG